jgi:hypothetical protein
MWGKMTGPAAGSVLDMPLVIEPGFAGLFSRARCFVLQRRHTHEHFLRDVQARKQMALVSVCCD